MEAETPQNQVFIRENGQLDNLLRKRYLSSCLFGLAILLFLLPFSEVKCSSTTLAGNSGLGIALGWQWKIALGGKNSDWMQKLAKDAPSGTQKELKDKPNVFAIVALVSAIAGIIFSFFRTGNRSLFIMSAGILAAIMLIALMIQFKLVLQSSLSEKGAKNEWMGSIIRVQFTFWYYLCLVLFSGAAFAGYRQHQFQLQDALKQAYDFEFERQQKSG